MESGKQVPPIPFLPGNSFTDPKKTSFAKTQTLGYKAGHRTSRTEYLGIGHDLQHTLENRFSEEDLNVSRDWIMTWKERAAPAPQEYVPAFVALDKLVLEFNGYFKEPVHESPSENYRVRRVNIHYYLEDDTICILEPKQNNSGMPQGVFLRRHRVPRNERDVSAGFYTLDDFGVGVELPIYGLVYRITDANGSTREYLARQGKELAPAEAIPSDPHQSFRANMERKAVSHPSATDTSLRQFLKYDRQVLRFYCRWDDRANMFGELRNFVLHYFLASDEIEVVEVRPPNSGHEPFPAFVRRSKVPKVFRDLKDISPSQLYTDADLRIGAHINVFNRELVIYDCDEFTKEHLRAKFGITDFTPLIAEEAPVQGPQREFPPYLGLGSEEDSLATCFHIVPRTFQKDFGKMLRCDRQILRFLARLETNVASEIPRRFVVTYYMGDDTMAVFEPPRRNSGQVHGKLMERARAKKTGTNLYYSLADLQLGGVMEFAHRRFVLLDADVFTLKAMAELPCPKPNLARLEQEFRLRLYQEKPAVLPVLAGLPNPCPLARLKAALEPMNLGPTMLEMEALQQKYPGPVDIRELVASLEEGPTIQAGQGAPATEMTGMLESSSPALQRSMPHSLGATSTLINRSLLGPQETEQQFRERMTKLRTVLDRFNAKVSVRHSSLTDIFREFTGRRDARLSLDKFTAHTRFLGVCPRPEDMDLLVSHFFGESQEIGYQDFVRGMHPDEKPLSFDQAIAVLKS